LGVGLSGTVFALLGPVGWAGAELSYRHMIGVAGHNDQLAMTRAGAGGLIANAAGWLRLFSFNLGFFSAC
jgi:hypothetical protein